MGESRGKRGEILKPILKTHFKADFKASIEKPAVPEAPWKVPEGNPEDFPEAFVPHLFLEVVFPFFPDALVLLRGGVSDHQ